jgi:acetyl esterase/lipase
MGDSAGGGLAAAVALLARERGGPDLACQILVYPMLDDRNTTPDPEIAPFAVWSYDDNITGWGALLGKGPRQRRTTQPSRSDRRVPPPARRPHGFETYARANDVARRSSADRIRALHGI